MKITSAQLSPRALQHSLSGVVVRATKNGIVIQKWPKKRGASMHPIQKHYAIRFGFAARMAANPEPLSLLTAMEMAKGTEQVPRDILTMAALGVYYEPIGPDGQQWGHVPGPLYDPAL